MKFTWLHLSDLHAGMRDEEYFFPSVRKDLFADLEHLLNKTGQVDLVLFTGDLAYRGSQEDYAKAEKILNRLCQGLKKISGNEPRLAVVPGNHDLERPNDTNELARLKLLSDNVQIQCKFWHEDDSSLRKTVEKMFRGYTEW